MVMRYGVFLAPFGDLSDPNLVADLAATAQDKGFDGVFVWACRASAGHRQRTTTPMSGSGAGGVVTDRLAFRQRGQ
jgi:hypothetical protein